MQFLLKSGAPVEQRAPVVFLEQSLELLEVGEVVDFGQVAPIDVILAVESLLDLSEQGLLELGVDLLLHVDVVDPYAGLPAVQVLPEDDPLDRTIDVGGFVDDDRTLASQLEDAGREVLGSLDCHQPASLGGAGEADDVELHLGECLGDLDPPLDHPVEP